ncbi:uncharacterized protein EV422DRAFT_429647 [Fimicolochytrium jonesii]|uniref:uncharacterized protein n=1 Tax=Fimicolochytrium jonesii TaxID=1396493 RepID=UPI0022FE2E06|nr:uncharacterized protein EV422DRAFT_429647 [Fimicolochytrium jonesii]KAI8821724.1 hypothetical protein EV422DRAFT_429647 [Fimicolochytrium jonesii]
MIKPFSSCWLDSIDTGMNWVQLVGCTMVMYGYLISNRRGLWTIVLAHGAAGFLGTIMESAFIANDKCEGATRVGLILGFNELNWITNEIATVYYSLCKIEVIITQDTYRRYLRYFMGVLALIFTGFRMNIGILRVRDNVTGNPAISEAHSWAFIIWGIADLLIFFMLVGKTYMDIHDAKQQQNIRGAGDLIMTLMKSSLLRLIIICANTLAIVVVGQIKNPTPTLAGFNQFLWMIKGTYPIILLFDILTTQAIIKTTVNSRVKSQNSASDKSKNAASDRKLVVQPGVVGSSRIDGVGLKSKGSNMV